MISIYLDKILKEKKLTQAKFAELIKMHPVTLSRKINGSIPITLSEIDIMCKELECNLNDILIQQYEKKGVIPLFLDYSGTTDLLLNGGAENVKGFFDAIIELQNKTNHQVYITMVTGSSLKSAKAKYIMLDNLACSYNLPNLFNGVIAEYCGYFITKNSQDSFEINNLLPINSEIVLHRHEIENLALKYNGTINSDISTLYNVYFDEISRTSLAEFASDVEKILNNKSIEALTYYDEYGKECDIKSKEHTKSRAVSMVTKMLNKQYFIPLVIIGGDSKEEDLKMYTDNVDKFKELEIDTTFIAPSNIGNFTYEDEHIFLSNWENAKGIVECIENLTTNIKLDNEGKIVICKNM